VTAWSRVKKKKYHWGREIKGEGKEKKGEGK